MLPAGGKFKAGLLAFEKLFLLLLYKADLNSSRN